MTDTLTTVASLRQQRRMNFELCTLNTKKKPIRAFFLKCSRKDLLHIIIVIQRINQFF